MFFKRKPKTRTVRFTEPAEPIYDKDGNVTGVRGTYTPEQFRAAARRAELEVKQK